MPALVFICILIVNVVGAYWVAANPDFLQLIGNFVDVYVFPGVLAFFFSVFVFWCYCELRFIANRLQHEFGDRR